VERGKNEVAAISPRLARKSAAASMRCGYTKLAHDFARGPSMNLMLWLAALVASMGAVEGLCAGVLALRGGIVAADHMYVGDSISRSILLVSAATTLALIGLLLGAVGG
jgi:hypothetical protein